MYVDDFEKVSRVGIVDGCDVEGVLSKQQVFVRQELDRRQLCGSIVWLQAVRPLAQEIPNASHSLLSKDIRHLMVRPHWPMCLVPMTRL